MKKIKTLFILTIIIITRSYGQNYHYLNTPQFWSEADFSGKITSKLLYQFDIQYARQGYVNDQDLFRYNSQLTFRPWLHYYIKPNIRISAFTGLWYNYAIAEVGAREYPEWRPAVQLTLYYPKTKYTLSHRFRMENRIIKDREGNFEDVLRTRYQLKFVRPVGKHIPETKGAGYIVGFDELFVNWGSQVTGHHLFDQNRIFFGYGYYLTDNLILETGYFNQFQLESNGNNFDINHVWQLTLYINNVFNKIVKNSTPD